MTRLIGAELLKLRKRGMTWILLGILIGIMVLFYTLVFAFSQRTFPGATPAETATLPQLLGLPMAIPFALLWSASLGALLSAILSASTTGSEYNWRTIRLAAQLISVAVLGQTSSPSPSMTGRSPASTSLLAPSGLPAENWPMPAFRQSCQ